MRGAVAIKHKLPISAISSKLIEARACLDAHPFRMASEPAAPGDTGALYYSAGMLHAG
jgi:hypothetical protein